MDAHDLFMRQDVVDQPRLVFQLWHARKDVLMPLDCCPCAEERPGVTHEVVVKLCAPTAHPCGDIATDSTDSRVIRCCFCRAASLSHCTRPSFCTIRSVWCHNWRCGCYLSDPAGDRYLQFDFQHHQARDRGSKLSRARRMPCTSTVHRLRPLLRASDA